MPEESEPLKEKKMAQDWRRGQRSQEWEREDNQRQSMPCGTSPRAGSEREASCAGTQAQTKDRSRRTRKPEVQMYVPRPMRNRLKKQVNTSRPSVPSSHEANQPERKKQSSEEKGKKSSHPRKCIDSQERFEEPTEKREKLHKSHRESLPTGSKKYRSDKECGQGNDRVKKDDGLRQKGIKEMADIRPKSQISDRQVRESIKKEPVATVGQLQPWSLASDCEATETVQNTKELSLPDQESKETPEKDAKVPNAVHLISLPGPGSNRKEQQVINDSETVRQEDYSKSAEGITCPNVPSTESYSHCSSGSNIHREASSGLTDVEMSFQDNSGKTDLCNEVFNDIRFTDTVNMFSKEDTEHILVGDQSKAILQSHHCVEVDSALTVTKEMETELAAHQQTLSLMSTHHAQLAGDKTLDVQDVPCDTKSTTSSIEVVDVTVGSENTTGNPEGITSSLRAGECTVLTDKENSEQTKETNSPELTSENKTGVENSSNENDDEDNNEEFWDAETELKGTDLAKEDGVMLEELEATCEDGQQGVAVAMETDEENWDAMFDDDGECLNPDHMEELLSGVRMVKVTTQKPKHDYWNWTPKEIQLEKGYEHVVELSDFPAEFKTPDLVSALAEFQSQGFNIKWVDDTHALAIFSTGAVAMRALQIKNPLLRVKPMSEATQQSKKKVKNCAEFLQPFKSRPAASAMVARRLVSGALGVRANIPKEKREEERRKLKEAKERKRLEIEQRESAWEGR
ncbi:uncharacterized protein LOC144869762 [Branchiostoma floridae x Branchiostoma japonicum]